MTEPTALTKPKPLYLEVAEVIRQQIYARELQPGNWIDEMKMVDALGISRTPLREALKVLAAEGLITMKVRRGAYVTEVSEKDLRDVYHLLAVLESDAAALVAVKATPEQMQELHDLHLALENALADAGRFFQINEQFHLRLLTLCDNRFLLQTVADLRKVMKLNRHMSLFRHGRLKDSLLEHGVIMLHLTERNADAARQAMLKHFENGLLAAVNKE